MLSPQSKIFQSRSDQSIAKLVCNGHKELFEVLILRYQRRLMSFLLRLSGSVPDAEDLTQETFINAYFNLNKFDSTRAFYPWLFTIGHHLAVNHYHKNNKIRILDIEKLPEVADTNNNGLEEVLKTEKEAILRENLSKLDGKYRLILELRYLNDKSYSEIAQILNIPVNTVKSRLFRAKNFLYQQLGTKSWGILYFR